MLYGIIDIGSNTIRMAVYQIRGDSLEMLMKKKHTVGLAAYVKDGVMQQAGIDKTITILKEFKEFLHWLSIDNIVVFTTAALRNAKNSREAIAAINAGTGLQVRVISGDEEAVFDFIGAAHDLHADEGILVDIGGASTEIVHYKGRSIAHKVSVPLGSLALRTRHVTDLLPTSKECEAMREEAKQALGSVKWLRGMKADAIAGIGGTFKGATALYNGLFGVDPVNKHLEAGKLRRLIADFSGDIPLTEEQTCHLMRAVPDRMHTVIPGLIIADVLMRIFGCQTITYSDSGVREGYLYDRVIGRQ